MLTPNSKSFLQLLLRSPDRGDGWRTVSDGVWPLVTGFKEQELLEVDEAAKRVRLSPNGAAVAEYLI